MKRVELECINCHTRIALDKRVAGCPNCGENILEARYDLSELNVERWLEEVARRPHSLWRYHEVLPILDTEQIVSLGEGDTPLIKSRALAANLGLRQLYIKDERQGPTASFKDRQATVAISALREIGVDEVVVASTGNVAISYAAYCARAGIKLWAFFPSLTPNEKMREAALYGAEVIKVTGTYDQTKELAAKFAQRRGIFLDRGIKSVAAIEAMKTMAYEIAEQLAENYGLAPAEGGKWRAPDWFIQSVSGGMGPIGVGKGFRELYDFGIIDSMPRLGVIQSSGCAPMVEAFERGQRIATPVDDPQTVIATLATGNPARAYELLFDYVEQYGGTFVSASDQEAFEATRIVARNDGLSVEPATGVTFAGLFKMVQRGILRPDDVVVVNCSGHTLPVELEILDEQWQRQFDVSQRAKGPTLPQEGLISAIEGLTQPARRVVVMEDNVDAARLIRRMMQARGAYEVQLAHDGASGFAMVEAIKPDLVITDLMMPGLDGFAVIERMKADPELQSIPIVVVTAKELSVRERTWLSQQVELLLQKGGSIDEELVESLVTKFE